MKFIKIMLLYLLSEVIIWLLVLLLILQFLTSAVCKITNYFGLVKANKFLTKIKLAEPTDKYPDIKSRNNAKLLVLWIIVFVFQKKKETE